MERASLVLRHHHIKVTPQRLSVYLALGEGKNHLSADEIYKKSCKRVPAISLATVYAILDNFCKKGLMREIKIDFNKSLYEKNRDVHYHFFCRKCKQVFDVDMPNCVALKSKKVDGHVIDDFHGYFYGVCSQCHDKGKK